MLSSWTLGWVLALAVVLVGAGSWSRRQGYFCVFPARAGSPHWHHRCVPSDRSDPGGPRTINLPTGNRRVINILSRSSETALRLRRRVADRQAAAPPDTGRVLPLALLVVAHPDDECMFFAPTLLNLLPAFEMAILCLSSGNADGLGPTRTREMLQACERLGVAAELVHVLDVPALQDGQLVDWQPADVLQAIDTFAATRDIDLIITFDEHGISGHRNHAAIPQALLAARRGEVSHSGRVTHTPVLLLASPSLLAKYLPPALSSWLPPPRPALPSAGALSCLPAGPFRFELTCVGEATAQAAMRMHASQWNWFRRWLYWPHSSLVYLNDMYLLE
ncbi:hypothetical protein H696_00674 [Fonticula alba]|uniref:N-acetylglucosaminylphosphatidylinositol deacetylase n=1 Tax=Fonticula alba TaxID=691883 RepID=A0A058ZGN2_FONAL|nr:hypothetical protein H696_00674 [Fonticula alba]KCV73126.1 hypothetical protein H696_00674 [Fonticula alba]|eukprot:XP_009492827.1 hypothetical protein H696_00674 [Fonticula alba]